MEKISSKGILLFLLYYSFVPFVVKSCFLTLADRYVGVVKLTLQSLFLREWDEVHHVGPTRARESGLRPPYAHDENPPRATTKSATC
jgi:hypothetical protein